MKKTLIILMIMAACLAGTALAAPNLLTNASFEDDTVAPGTPDGWTLAASNFDGLIYHPGEPANANSGDDFFEISCGAADNWAVIHTNTDIDAAVTAGNQYTVSGFMKLAIGTTYATATLKIEWYSVPGGAYNDGGPDGIFLGEDSLEFELTDSYVLYYTTATAPANAVAARVAVIATWSQPDYKYYVDDVGLCEGDQPCEGAGAVLVSPENGTFVDPAIPGADDLFWTNPEPVDPHSPIECDVWFNIDDPNVLNLIKIVDRDAVETVNLVAAGQDPVELDHDYYWRVDCYDPNIIENGGTGTTGTLWMFTTKNTAPWAEAGFDRNAWLENGTVTVVLDPKPSANDDVDNYPGPLTAIMSTTGGTFDTAPGEDPNTITFTAPGTYTLTMTADDDGPGTEGLITTDSFDITVYAEDTAENYLVAHYPLDTDALDATGNNHHGSLAGDAFISGADTQVGAGALELDGTDDYVVIIDSANASDPEAITWADFGSPGQSEEFTISVWIKATDWSRNYTQVVSKGYPGGYRITRGDYDGVVFATDLLWDGGVVYGSDIYQMGDGDWHHLAATWDGGASALYIDGNFQYRMPQPHDTLLIKNGAFLQIGANEDADNTQHFEGLIDDVRIYDVGFSHAEVLKLYASQGGSGTCGKNYSNVDIDEDCAVTLSDFALFASEWMDCRDPITCP